ncbi:hypothetical protein CMUS01_12590 [Colletotrichum musicola]|uniref:Uncharacterized protein n=1 Tax=Colletotrichum musicola TaxID=2175873 RepID=A0A8H6JKC8_9PEZI|nr:hypothetical protein CMUS01_12590 [Colletotrichum musicola]
MSTPEKQVPAGPYSPSTHEPIVLDDLEVGSLYLMISVPLPIYLGRQKHTYAEAISSDPDLLPSFLDELGAASGHGGVLADEFHWDLYWHTRSSPDGGSGVVYRLRSVTTNPPTYAYDRVPVFRVRTHAQLVGLVRVISVPRPVIPHLSRYLDWMAQESSRAPQQRSGFLWAAAAYRRVRQHLTGGGGGVRDHGFDQFDVDALAAEALSFAYREVSNVLGGRSEGPRPVVASWLGVSLRFLQEDEVLATRRKRDEMLRRQREQFKAVRSFWYY